MFPASSNHKQALALAINALLERPAVHALLAALHADGQEARVVGGAVRDILMGRAIGDVDIATTVLPEAVIRLAISMGWRAIPTGIDHGTVTVIIDGVSYEVTTLRRDVETNGRRAVVSFSRDFKEDAFRRDFTINAMSLSPDGTIHDYATGISDARHAVIRFMGEPETRIQEDYLRILRFFRFQATHGAFGVRFEEGLSAADYRACALHKAGLVHLSRERIRQEVLKLLDAQGCAEAVRAMGTIGVWEVLLPECERHFSVLEHLIALEKTTKLKAGTMVRVAALFGRAKHSSGLQHSLALSNRELKRILTAEKLSEEMKTVPLADNTLRKIIFLGDINGFTDALLLKHARIHANPQSTVQELARAKHALQTIPKNPFSSAYLIDRNIEPGPQMGIILKKAFQSWLDSGLSDDALTQKRILDNAIATTGIGFVDSRNAKAHSIT